MVKRINKNANTSFEQVVKIIIVLVAGLAIIAITAYTLGVFKDPDAIQEGLKCRLAIQASSTIREASAGLGPKQIFDACPTIEKTIPLREDYPFIATNLNKMTQNQLKEVVMFDFAHLINNAWWITGEGDKADSVLDKFQNIFSDRNDCYVVYAVRISTPRAFTPVSENDLQFRLNDIKRADLRASSGKGDPRTIRAYITLDGKGAGVFLNTRDSKIEFQERGADPHYGIAVGFAKEGRIAKLVKALWGNKGHSEINKGQSFIYIAPYEDIAKYCKVI